MSKRSAGSRHSQLRVSGQKRLSASNKTDEDRQPKPLPDGTQVCAEHDEDILRVYDPDRSEAYITSDTWQNIER